MFKFQKNLAICEHRPDCIKHTIVKIDNNIKSWISETIGFSEESMQNVHVLGVWEGAEYAKSTYFRKSETQKMNNFSDKLMLWVAETIGTAQTLFKVFKNFSKSEEYILYCVLLIEVDYQPSKRFYNIDGSNMPTDISLIFNNDEVLSVNINVTFIMPNMEEQSYMNIDSVEKDELHKWCSLQTNETIIKTIALGVYPGKNQFKFFNHTNDLTEYGIKLLDYCERKMGNANTLLIIKKDRIFCILLCETHAIVKQKVYELDGTTMPSKLKHSECTEKDLIPKSL